MSLRDLVEQIAPTIEGRPHFVLVITVREIPGSPGSLELDAAAASVVDGCNHGLTALGDARLNELSLRLRTMLVDTAEDMGSVSFDVRRR